MLRTLALFVIVAFASVALSATSLAAESSPENLFQKGLAAYQNKDYPAARDLFQNLIASGSISPPLLHNLALTYVQLNDPAMALALWRKALTLAPGYGPARSGREFIELKLQTRGFERDQIGESIRRGLEFVSFYESLWLIALAMTAAGAMWIRFAADRRHALDEEAPLPAFPLSAALVSVIFALAVGLSTMKFLASMKTRATVIAKTASARSLPTADGVSLFELRGGSEVLIRRRDKDWSQVQNSDGNSGWVANQEIFITSK